MKFILLSSTLLGLSLILLSGCGSTSGGAGGCSSDTDCPGQLFCQEGNCICDTDDRCPEGEYCNPFGTCQVRPACLSNADCDSGQICNSADPTGGKCISADTCGSSVHCELNHYCSPTTQRCEPGCRSTGDCQIGYVCAAGSCVPGGTGADCTICPANPIPDASYCDYGEICTSEGQCQTHEDAAEICDSCSPMSGCSPGLICLVDDTVPDGNYCSPACTRDSDCPSGYGDCGGLQLVAEECTGGTPCSNGGRCLGGGEQQRGFCECVAQTDCNVLCVDLGFGKSCLNNFSSCNSDVDCNPCDGGVCTGTPLPCTTHSDCEVLCVEVPYGDDTVGICRTKGKVCGKDEGVTCNELTTGVSECRGI